MASALTTDQILYQLGQAGLRLDHMKGVEAGAGNLSYAVSWPVELGEIFPVQQADFKLPHPAPALAGRTVFVSGSGCRLREIAEDPGANVSAITINDDGLTGTWHYAEHRKFAKPTSEFNSHLAVHNDQVERREVASQVVVHAQPPHLVMLSHIDELRNDADFSRALISWEPETILQLPLGVAVLEYMAPSTDELMSATVAALADRTVAVWSKHGLMVRSDGAPLDAVDKIEYAETAAMYEWMNRQAGCPAKGLTDDELRQVARAYGIETNLV